MFVRKRMARRAAPIASTVIVSNSTLFNSCHRSERVSREIVWVIRSRFRQLNLPPSAAIKKVPRVMIPSPPSWIRAKMTSCPKREKCVPVSTTVSPVTHTADVAEKSASTRDSGSSALANGSQSKRVPLRTAAPNDTTSIYVGRSFLEGFIFENQ